MHRTIPASVALICARRAPENLQHQAAAPRRNRMNCHVRFTRFDAPAQAAAHLVGKVLAATRFI
jgi:hypothetical protein